MCRENMGTLHALALVTDFLKTYIDRGICIGIFPDLAEAFDAMHHQQLVKL